MAFERHKSGQDMTASVGTSMKQEQGETSVEDSTDDSIAKKEPSSGPIRTKGGQSNETNGEEGGGSSKAPIAAPVKAACTFCRSR